MGLGRKIYTFFKLESYIHIPIKILFLNWVFQRIFRNNSEAKFSVHFTSKVSGANHMNIHNSVKPSFAVSNAAHIVAVKGGEISIGENTIFAHNVCIQGISHDLYDRKKMYASPVIIGKNCWLGNSVTITSGVTLGDNVTVGANSVVTKSFSSNVVIGGVPAKIIKTLE